MTSYPSGPTLDEIVRALSFKEPTPEQAEVAQYPPFLEGDQGLVGAPLLVVAGAGSGKTETLSLRATYLAANYQIPGSGILGLTFTRKAAGELSQRLTDRLLKWSEMSGDSGASHSGYGSMPRSIAALDQTPEATTYNAFALSIVQEFGIAAGLNPQVTHMGEAAAWQLMSEVVAGWEGDLPRVEAESTVVDRAIQLRDSMANQALSLSDVRRGLTRLIERFESAKAEGKKSYTKSFHQKAEETIRQRFVLLDIIEEFDRRKSELGMMDYADQVVAAIRIVESSPQVREEIRRRHQIVFLDEFQDTSVAQLRFLSALFANHPVTAVGDPNQAIYGWRGASAASLDDFHSNFTTDGAPQTVLTLSTAWRNDKSILEAANVLAAPLAKTPSYVKAPVAADEEIVLPDLTPRKGAGQGFVAASFQASQAQALQEAVDFVRRNRRALPQDREAKPKSVAVLARNRALLQPMVTALRQEGIPAQIVGGDALLEHPTIRDLRATLEVVSDVGKSAQLLRLLAHLDLGAADFRALGAYARHLSYTRPKRGRYAHGSDASSGEREPALLLDAVQACCDGEKIEKLSEAGQQRIAALGRKFALLRQHSGAPIIEQVQYARKVMGFDLEAASDPTAEDVTAVLDVFADTALEYESSAVRPTMEAFLAWLDAAENKERGLVLPSVKPDDQAVQVMTIHASKGLEWDAVAIIDVAAGRFPSGGGGSRRSKGEFFRPPNPAPQSGWIHDSGALPYPLRADSAHLPNPDIWDMSRTGGSLSAEFREEVGQYLQDEERRLAYVAVTRARSALLLAGSWFGSGKTPRFPSIFMNELCDSDEMSKPLLTKEDVVPLPPQDEWEDLAADNQPASFPRDPSVLRQKASAAAANVMAAKRALDRETNTDEPGYVDEILGNLGNERLAADVRALLNERARQVEESDASPDSEQIVALVAASRPLAVTELADLAAQPEQGIRDLVRPVPKEPTDSALLGTALHAWMERRLQRLSVEGADWDREEEPAGAGHLSQDDTELLEELIESASMFDTSGYDVVAVEVPFAVTEAGRIVRGRIDAVLKDQAGRYTLVDWKTSRTKKTRLSDAERKRYATQLSYYRAAWQSAASTEGAEVTGQLVFFYPGGMWTITEDELVAD